MMKPAPNMHDLVPVPVAFARPAPAAARPLSAAPDRPWAVRLGKRLRGTFDRLIAGSSLVSNAPVLDVRDFPWTAVLRERWTEIRDEAMRVALTGNASPSLAVVSPDHRAIAEVGKWRSFFLWGYGYRIDDNLVQTGVFEPEDFRVEEAFRCAEAFRADR